MTSNPKTSKLKAKLESKQITTNNLVKARDIKQYYKTYTGHEMSREYLEKLIREGILIKNEHFFISNTGKHKGAHRSHRLFKPKETLWAILLLKSYLHSFPKKGYRDFKADYKYLKKSFWPKISVLNKIISKSN